MARRHITECDRCHREVKAGEVRVKDIDGNGYDLCTPCADKLQKFLDGRELEVPP